MGVVKFVIMYEVRLWLALFRWILRRPRPVPPGSAVFHYSGAVKMILVVLLFVSAIEIPILHLMLPWESVRVLSLIVGFYGLFWMVGLLATMRIYPHVVSPAALRIRNSITVDVPLNWADVSLVRCRPRSLPPGGQTQVEDGVLSLGMAGGTTVDVVLARPLVVPVRKTRGAAVTEIRFHADDADGLVAAAGAFLPPKVS
ncbi:hypothetical protein GCM10010172_75850 [Paractinoplanes ferrugineus]|uniref:PH domain-containing protein n=1 Tax=Paractinoplanes ferrugineus TaxID=113564 RepID=A0A919IYP2_9ACTN|nr:hypothetical protein [Actinoplanes ferrugineus]GIE11260.1 hypothetical protein Afe05nite_31000 [Actinoplanes ferrugineus]